MAIKIWTQKVLKNSSPYRKIIKFKMLSNKETPGNYAKGYPAIYSIMDILGNKRDMFIVRHASGKIENISRGDVIPEKQFKKIVQTAKEAGLVLHMTNRANKSAYPEHFAEKYETIKI